MQLLFLKQKAVPAKGKSTEKVEKVEGKKEAYEHNYGFNVVN